MHAPAKPKRNRIEPTVGPGKFQWNKGGWIGAAFGGSCWMLLLSILLASKAELLLASVLLAWFFVINLTSYFLWTHRNRIAPFWGMQAQLFVVAIAIPCAFYAVINWGTKKTLTALDVPDYTFWIYVMVPAIMVLFAYQEWNAVRKKRDLVK